NSKKARNPSPVHLINFPPNDSTINLDTKYILGIKPSISSTDSSVFRKLEDSTISQTHTIPFARLNLNGCIVFIKWLITCLRLPQAAFRDLVPGRNVQPFKGSWHWDEGGLRQEHV